MGKVKPTSWTAEQVARLRRRLLGEERPKPERREFVENEGRRVFTERLNAVCFSCRVAERWPGGREDCRECGKPLSSIGTRLRVPPRRDKRAWRKLKNKTRPYLR